MLQEEEEMFDGMKSSLVCSSGTYNVRASEVARHKLLRSIRVQVIFLDDSKQVFEVEKRAKGQALLDLVFSHLELTERDYFGLQYVDSRISSSEHNSKRWLDPQKSVKRQLQIRTKTIGTCGRPQLWFRVKFWVCDPGKLAEEYTRYHLFLQLRRDILEERLVAPPSTAALLASYALQSDLGDYNLREHGVHYLEDMKFVPDQNGEILTKIIELHKLHKGQTPADAEYNFLDHAKRLDLYGVDLHSARDSANHELQIGVTSSGLVVFHNQIKINTFSWAKIIKISFKRNNFFIQLRRECMEEGQQKRGALFQFLKRKLLKESENYDSILGFNLGSYRACKCLWKSCVEHHTFFRLHTPKPPTRKLHMLHLGSKFRYSGKTEFQSVEESKKKPIVHRTFVRSPSKQLMHHLGASPFDPALSIPPAPASRQTTPPIFDISSLTPSEIKRPTQLDIVGRSAHITTAEPGGRATKSRSASVSSLRARADSCGYKVTSSSNGIKAPKPAWGEDEAGRAREIIQMKEEKEVAIAPPQAPAAPLEHGTLENGLPLDTLPSANDESTHGLVTIRIKPDGGGKFGFNVKGGVDQNQPVLVSRVAPGTPADCCYPRLNEGDQVLLINGRDVSPMSHEQVVNFIKASRECHSGELVLTVKQNVYMTEELDEPSFRYVPEVPPSAISSTPKDPQMAPLHESMLLLSEGLEGGSLIAQFEQLYRRKPGLTFSEARKQENEKKNRYRDISPYDSTRVVLSSIETGDYINASHVVMKIPGSAIVNRYIACQGPLSLTCLDFWQMVWEQQSTLVVMLTTVVEQGRVKCYKYWPKLCESMSFGHLEVSCTKEDETPGFAYREISLVDKKNHEERHITHMQYLAWPDHGVPDDATEFLNFISKVRTAREGMVEPTVVHCSAGIGRTGVMILMETAQCLIEANEPVYPLDIVKTMRDQRAMMIQTSSQYRFVCEAIQKVYAEDIVKPLPEFQQQR